LVLFGAKFQPYRRLDVFIGSRLFCFNDTDKRLLRHPPPAIFWQHTHSSAHFRNQRVINLEVVCMYFRRDIYTSSILIVLT
jgi:hypothetical protein